MDLLQNDPASLEPLFTGPESQSKSDLVNGRQIKPVLEIPMQFPLIFDHLLDRILTRPE